MDDIETNRIWRYSNICMGEISFIFINRKFCYMNIIFDTVQI